MRWLVMRDEDALCRLVIAARPLIPCRPLVLSMIKTTVGPFFRVCSVSVIVSSMRESLLMRKRGWEPSVEAWGRISMMATICACCGLHDRLMRCFTRVVLLEDP